MATEVHLTGRVGGDPEIRFTQSGKAVCSFSVVTDRRSKNPDSGEWESHDTTWWRVTAWERLGESVTEVIRKGDAVIVIGRASMREYEKDGQTRQSLDVQAWHVGKDLRWHTGASDKVARSEGKPAADDPWADAPF